MSLLAVESVYYDPEFRIWNCTNYQHILSRVHLNVLQIMKNDTSHCIYTELLMIILHDSVVLSFLYPNPNIAPLQKKKKKKEATWFQNDGNFIPRTHMKSTSKKWDLPLFENLRERSPYNPPLLLTWGFLNQMKPLQFWDIFLVLNLIQWNQVKVQARVFHMFNMCLKSKK